MAYTPYTSAQCKIEIERVLELIKEHSGKSNMRLENDKDRIETNDIMRPLYNELAFWQKQLDLAETAEGTKSSQVRFIRYDMGY
jgi:hypothetical protein